MLLRNLVPSLAALLGIAACGEVKTLQSADAPVQIDAPTPIDAPHRGTASIKLLDFNGDGSAVTGAETVFTDAFQTTRTVTDGSGVASVEISDDATVTVVLSGGTNFLRMLTVYHVKIGDMIELGEPVSTSTSLGTFAVNFTPVNIGSAAASYEVFGPCGAAGVTVPGPSSSATATLSIQSSCKADPMEILITGTDNTTGQSLGFIDKPGVSFVANGGTTVTGAFQPLVTFTTQVTDGSALSSFDVERESPDNFGFGRGASGNLSSGSGMFLISGPVTSKALTQIDMQRVGFGEQDWLANIDGSATTFPFDVGSNAMTWIGQPTFDPGTLTIHTPVATDDTNGGPLSLFEAVLVYERAAGSGSGQPTENTEVAWFAFSSSADDLVLPRLPPEVTPFGPLPGDAYLELDVEAYASTDFSQDKARQQPFALQEFEDFRSLTGPFQAGFNQGSADFADGSGSGTMSNVKAVSRGRWSRPRVLHDAARAR
jgi:hypothetical protein